MDLVSRKRVQRCFVFSSNLLLLWWFTASFWQIRMEKIRWILLIRLLCRHIIFDTKILLHCISCYRLHVCYDSGIDASDPFANATVLEKKGSRNRLIPAVSNSSSSTGSGGDSGKIFSYILFLAIHLTKSSLSSWCTGEYPSQRYTYIYLLCIFSVLIIILYSPTNFIWKNWYNRIFAHTGRHCLKDNINWNELFQRPWKWKGATNCIGFIFSER